MFTTLEGGKDPVIKTEFSSSADLCSRIDLTIQAGETKVIPLGVKINLEELKKSVIKDYIEFGNGTNWGVIFEDKAKKEHDKIFNKFLKSHFLELKIRSSLSFKLIVSNGVGEIDLDYPDEIGLIVHNPFSGTYDSDTRNVIADINNEVDIKAGDRVAQIKLMEHKNFLAPEAYRTGEKRVGGYGSTQ